MNNILNNDSYNKTKICNEEIDIVNNNQKKLKLKKSLKKVEMISDKILV